MNTKVKLISAIALIGVCQALSGCVTTRMEESGLDQLNGALSGVPATPSLEGYTISLKLTNVGESPANVNLSLLSNAIASVRVFNEERERLPTLPPAAWTMPSNYKKHEWKKIRPGEVHETDIVLGSFSDEPPPGTYYISLSGIQSNEVAVLVLGSQ